MQVARPQSSQENPHQDNQTKTNNCNWKSHVSVFRPTALAYFQLHLRRHLRHVFVTANARVFLDQIDTPQSCY